MFVGFDAMMSSHTEGISKENISKEAKPVTVEGQFEDADSEDESGTDDDDSRMSICSDINRQVASPPAVSSVDQPERADAKLLLNFVSQTSTKVARRSEEEEVRTARPQGRRPLPPKKNWSRNLSMNASICRDTEIGRLAHSNSFKPIETIQCELEKKNNAEEPTEAPAAKQDSIKLLDDEADSSSDESSEKQARPADCDEKKARIPESEIRDHDVLCGRGGGTNNHVGNRYFRLLVDQYRRTYVMAKKADKGMLAMGIVNVIRNTTLKGDSTEGGRFLKKNEKTGYWYDIGDAKAAEKTSQALREGLAKKMREVISLSTRTSLAHSLSQHLQLPAQSPPALFGSPETMDTSGFLAQTPPMFGFPVNPSSTTSESTFRRQSGSVHYMPRESVKGSKRQRHSL